MTRVLKMDNLLVQTKETIDQRGKQLPGNVNSRDTIMEIIDHISLQGGSLFQYNLQVS